ncbi:MAG: mechanosensitive ion channel family protein [Candidatus Nomurabacteria bacterium]|nr:mechanosensitive ion channel family protein [Candidatus Saccharibacteria bacterium]USN95942.1 MAG: mechanosensitive ion channel family protein [Candidatus Nomurabacteria bacterium]
MWETAINNLGTRINEVWHLLIDWASAHLIQILIIVIGSEILLRVLNKAVSKVLHKLTYRPDLFPTDGDRKKRLKTLDSLINASLRLGIFIIATVMIISELGINTAPLIASAGVIGVALGFGAQNLIRDFMSGFFIITENQYRVGDTIEITTNIGAAKVSGTVESITIRTTTLRDIDGRIHHIPNGSIMIASNMTMHYAGFNEEIVVDKKTDIDKLEHIINHVGEELIHDTKIGAKIIQPPYFDRVDAIDSNGVRVKIFGKTAPGEQWRIRGIFYKKLLPALEKNHIKLASSENIPK